MNFFQSIVIFITTCSLSYDAFSQDSLSKLSIAIHYTPSFSFVQHKNQGNLDAALYESIIEDDLKKIVNPISLNFYYRLKKGFEIQAGIGYQELGQKTKIYESQLTNDSLISTQFFVSHRYFSIPLTINYHFKPYFFGLGTDLNFHLSSHEKQVSTLKDGESVSKRELDKIRPFNPLVRATIGYNVKIGQKLSFSLAPTVAFTPSYLSGKDVQINRKYWQVGLDVRLMYGF